MAISDNETTDYSYYVDRDGAKTYIYFMKYDTDNDKWITIDVARDYKVEGAKTLTDFTSTLTETSDIPEEFHEALAYYVIQQEYQSDSKERPMDMKKASYFGAGFKKIIKEMKSWARNRQYSTGYIKPHTY